MQFFGPTLRHRKKRRTTDNKQLSSKDVEPSCVTLPQTQKIPKNCFQQGQNYHKFILIIHKVSRNIQNHTKISCNICRDAGAIFLKHERIHTERGHQKPNGYRRRERNLTGCRSMHDMKDKTQTANHSKQNT